LVLKKHAATDGTASERREKERGVWQSERTIQGIFASRGTRAGVQAFKS
jgi:hypothetical protein